MTVWRSYRARGRRPDRGSHGSNETRSFLWRRDHGEGGKTTMRIEGVRGQSLRRLGAPDWLCASNQIQRTAWQGGSVGARGSAVVAGGYSNFCDHL